MEFDNKIYFQEFSIGFDEMTSLQKKTHLIVYIHYVGSDNKKAVNFLAAVNMKHTTGLDLYAGVDTCLTLNSLAWRKRLVATITDGASNCLAQTNMLRQCPTAFGVHCCPHRGALACEKGVSALPRLSFVVESMGILGRSFRFSPQRLNAFLEIQETLQSSQKHIQESAFTRWLTNSEAFLSFFSSLPSALLFLRQHSATDNTCVGLFKTFSKIDNLCLVFILCDVFTPISEAFKNVSKN